MTSFSGQFPHPTQPLLSLIPHLARFFAFLDPLLLGIRLICLAVAVIPIV